MEKRAGQSFISKNIDVLASLLLCLAALVISLLLHPGYETNDDEIMEALLFGYRGSNGTSFLVFLNRILGCGLHLLVSVIPQVNWYFVMHYATCLVSLFILSRTFIRKFKLPGFFISVLTVAAGMEALYAVQFTKTAALAAVGGTIGLCFFLREKGHLVFKGFCIATILMGSMIRFESLEMSAPFLFCVALCETIDMLKNNKSEWKRYLIAYGLTLFLILGCYAGGNFINSRTPGSEDFYRYNSYRSMLTDLPIEATDGLSADAFMVENWMSNDPDYFTPDKLEQLSKAYSKENKLFTGEALKTYFGVYFTGEIFLEPLLLIVLAETVALLIFSRKRLYVLPLPVFFIILEWYLCSVGRAGLHRVNYGIYLAFFISLNYLADVSLPKLKENYRKLLRLGAVPAFMLIGAVIVCSNRISWYGMHRDYYLRMRASFEDATVNEEYQYMIHPYSLSVDMERNIFELPDWKNDGSFYMGGWQEGIYIPGTDMPVSDAIEGNPWETCIDSDTVRLVFPDEYGEYCMKIIPVYIEDHYGKKVTGVLEYRNDMILVYRVVSEE